METSIAHLLLKMFSSCNANQEISNGSPHFPCDLNCYEVYRVVTGAVNTEEVLSAIAGSQAQDYMSKNVWASCPYILAF